MKTLDGIKVRFFLLDWDEHDTESETADPTREITESEFRTACDMGRRIEYERHTIRENGVSQICFTAIID